MTDQKPADAGLGKIRAGGVTMLIGGIIIGIPILMMATSPAEGAQGWGGAMMLLGAVPLSLILGVTGLILMVAGLAQRDQG